MVPGGGNPRDRGGPEREAAQLGQDFPFLWARRHQHAVVRWIELPRRYGVPAERRDLALAVPEMEVPSGVTVIVPGRRCCLAAGRTSRTGGR
jgi:hypothetical protein